MKFFLLIHCGLKTAAFLREHMQQHRVIDALEKFEGLHQQGDVMAVDRAEVLKPELLKEHGRPEQALGGLFGAACDCGRGLAGQLLQDAMGRVVQVLVVLVGDNAVKITGNRAHVAVDGPLVVVEHNDHPLGLLGDVIERLKGDSIGEGRVAGYGDYVLLAAGEVAGDGHSQCGRQGSACVAGSVTIVLALSAEHEAVESARLANRIEAVEPPGEYFVDVCLVADIEEQLVFGGIEDRVQSQRQFHDSQIRT